MTDQIRPDLAQGTAQAQGRARPRPGARARTRSATGSACSTPPRAAFASGQDAVTLEQIARDAEVGIGTLYRHFPTREALVEALYRKELADLCASAGDLLEAHAPERALRLWMDRFADYVAAKREMADTLRAVFASGAVTVSQARGELTVAVKAILDAGVADGTLRDDVRPEDVVAMVVGIFTATSISRRARAAGAHVRPGGGRRQAPRSGHGLDTYRWPRYLLKVN